MNRRAELPPGHDEEDPYEDANIEELEEWWRENIKEFRSHGMRPYRPPRFQDGTLTPLVIEHLENEFNTTIRFRVVEPQVGTDWGIWIDDEQVDVIKRYRDEGGYSVYEMDAAEFEQLVQKYTAKEH